MPNGDPVLLGVPYTEKGLFEEELINCLSDSGDKFGSIGGQITIPIVCKRDKNELALLWSVVSWYGVKFFQRLSHTKYAQNMWLLFESIHLWRKYEKNSRVDTKKEQTIISIDFMPIWRGIVVSLFEINRCKQSDANSFIRKIKHFTEIFPKMDLHME